jgi:hypothetical protein
MAPTHKPTPSSGVPMKRKTLVPKLEGKLAELGSAARWYGSLQLGIILKEFWENF